MTSSHRLDQDRTESTDPPQDADEFDDLHEPIVGPLSLQMITLLVAAVFLVVGILGFIPGVTTKLPFGTGPRFSGPDSHAMLFGVFMVSVLHNFVHLAYAAVGAVASFFAPTARAYFLGGGVVYLVAWVYGLVVGTDSPANFVPVNTADDWLHFGLGVGMISLGVVLHLRVRAMRRQALS